MTGGPEGSTQPPSADGGLSRRGLLRRGGGLLAAGGVGYAVPRWASTGPAADSAPAMAATPSAGPVVLVGAHQPGIATARPAHVILTGYDLTGTANAANTGGAESDREQLRGLLAAWTAAARALAVGQAPPGAPDQIAAGLHPAALTVTVGVGGALLDRLAVPRPAGLAELPAFADDRLEAARGGGQLLVQVCADDPVVAFAAARALTRAARPAARPRWTQNGFLRTAAAARDPRATPRNLMGQVDGTDDVVPTDAQDGGPIWVALDADPAWLRGGSYLVYRRIRMLLEDWEATAPAEQDRAVGRHKTSGAPLGATGEHDRLDLTARTPTGDLVVPADAHVRLAHPSSNGGALMHRRVYSYDDGLHADGDPDAGLLFLAYQADPAAGFTPVMTRLAGADALGRFTVHTASAVFAVLPGLGGLHDTYGQALLAQT